MKQLRYSRLLVVALNTASTEISFPKDNSVLRDKKIIAIEVIPDTQMDKAPDTSLNSTDAQLKTGTVTLPVKGVEDIKQMPLHGLCAKNYNGNIREFAGQVIDWDKAKINLHTQLSALTAGACVIFNIYYE